MLRNNVLARVLEILIVFPRGQIHSNEVKIHISNSNIALLLLIPHFSSLSTSYFTSNIASKFCRGLQGRFAGSCPSSNSFCKRLK